MTVFSSGLRFAVASLVVSSLIGYAAWAHVAQRALAAGPELERWAALVGSDFPTTTVELNGHRLQLSTVTTDVPVRDVLDRFRARCRSASGGLAEELIDRKLPINADELDVGVGIMREELDGGGVVACLARSGPNDLVSRVANFMRTRDLADLGQLRYVFARTTEHGSTHALIVTSEGPLRVEAMFPEQGDASGSDLHELPRPAASRRVLSAQVHGSEYGVVAYEVTEAQPLAAIERYSAQLAPLGFRSIRLQPGDADAYESRALVRDEVPMQVHAFVHEGATVLAVVRMGGPSRARFTAER